MYTQLYEEITDALVEDGYIIVENALKKELLTALISRAKEPREYKKAAISKSHAKHLDSTKRSDKTVWIDAQNSEAEALYLEFSDGLKNYLNRSLYLGINEYESHFALYEAGDFYEKHLDAFRGSKNRVVTTVLYLNKEWSDTDGGELLIYDSDDKEIQKVKPNAGTLVVFLSDKFPHEVLPAQSKRHSIAGWFRVDGCL